MAMLENLAAAALETLQQTSKFRISSEKVCGYFRSQLLALLAAWVESSVATLSLMQPGRQRALAQDAFICPRNLDWLVRQANHFASCDYTPSAIRILHNSSLGLADELLLQRFIQ
jgi:hypothetical protein